MQLGFRRAAENCTPAACAPRSVGLRRKSTAAFALKPTSQTLPRLQSLAAALALCVAGLGCVGTRTPDEQTARRDVQHVAAAYRPGDQRPTLPTLTTNSPLADFLAFAILNDPKVEAAYYDWVAAVERITPARSLPNPRVTFQMDIMSIVTSLMPGLMLDLPGPGKLGARAAVASAESTAKYFAFEFSVVQAAFSLKKAYYQLFFLADKIRVSRQILELLSDLERLARAQNSVGKVTLQDVLRAQIELDRLNTEIAGLSDSRQLLITQFKAALGLGPDRPEPPLPARFESTPLNLSADQLWQTALARNPRLQGMAAEVAGAEAAIRLARRERIPDFSVGIEADVKALPTMYRPQLGFTLPIWRDKIAAEIAAAQAGKRAAAARLSAEQITLAVELADKLFNYRESSRNLVLLEDKLLAKGRQSVAVAQSGYLSGKIDFFNLIDAQRTLLGFLLSEVEARIQRELALAEISHLLLGTAPPNAPVLSEPPGAPKPKTLR